MMYDGYDDVSPEYRWQLHFEKEYEKLEVKTISKKLYVAQRMSEQYMKQVGLNEDKIQANTRDIITYLTYHYNYLYEKVIRNCNHGNDVIYDEYKAVSEFLKNTFGEYDVAVVDKKLEEFNILNDALVFRKCIGNTLITLVIFCFVPYLLYTYTSLFFIVAGIICYFVFSLIFSIGFTHSIINAKHPRYVKR